MPQLFSEIMLYLRNYFYSTKIKYVSYEFFFLDVLTGNRTCHFKFLYRDVVRVQSCLSRIPYEFLKRTPYTLSISNNAVA